MSGISAIALTCAPVVASNAIFSARRLDRGLDAIGENPLYGTMNFDIAAGQTLKGTQAATTLASATNKELAQTFQGATEAIKKASEGSKFLNGAGKVLKFTADNINPIICVTSGVKVLGSEDKIDTAAREVIALPTMFAAEKLARKAFGMPTFSKGKAVNQKAFFENQIKTFDDFCQRNKLFDKISLKYVPGVTKGLLFVGSSIAGYKLGNKVADCFLGKKEEKAN